MVVELQEGGQVDPIPHLTCVQQTSGEIDSILRRYAEAGVSNMLALRGDHPINDDGYDPANDDYTHAIELVEHVVRFNEHGTHPDPRGFGIGVAGFPEGHPETPNRIRQLDFLKAKTDAGAHWVTTQLFFDNADYFGFVARAREAGIEVPIVPGIMPVVSTQNIRRIAKLSQARIPEALDRELSRVEGDDPRTLEVGIEWATAQCRELLAGGAPGIHFYTLNRSPATRRIHESLFGAS